MEEAWTVELILTSPHGVETRLRGRMQQISPIPTVAFDMAPSIQGVPQVGQQLACDAVATPPTAELAYQWTRASRAIAGATAGTYRLTAEDDRTLVGCHVTARIAGAEISMQAPPMGVTFAPPSVAGPITARSYTQTTGAQTVEASDAFSGQDLRYSVSGAGATIDPVTGWVSIPTDALATEVAVTITATNSGGDATATFLISVLAPVAVHVAANGNDSAAGGPTTPVASLARAMELAKSGGTILLRRGDIWRESLTVSKDDVVISAYGNGPLPVISGGKTVTGLTRRVASGEAQLGSASFNDGSLSELVSLIKDDSSPVASTEAAQSGGYSMRITSNGTDGRCMGAIGASIPHGANSERSYFFAFRVSRSAVKASSQIRLLRLSAATVHHVYLSLRWDATRTFTTWELNNHTNNAFLSSSSPAVGVSWGEWNMVELRLATGTSGTVKLMVNGAEQISLTGNYSHANLAGINRMYVGNDAYGAGLTGGQFAYFDELRITAPQTEASLINTWTASLAENPPQVFINGERGRRMPTPDEVTEQGCWHWASGLLSVFGIGPAAPVVEASVRDVGVDLGNQSGIALQNLRIENAGRIGIRADDATRFTIQDADVVGCYVHGVQASGSTLRTGARVRRNLVAGCGGTGILFGGRLADWVVEQNVVDRCATLTQGVVGSGDNREAAFEWTAGIKIWGWGGNGWCGAYAIRGNHVRACAPIVWAPGKASTHGHGIWADEVLMPTARPAIHENTVSDCWSRGVYLEKTDNHDAFRNLVYGCAHQQYTASIQVDSNHYGYDVTLDQPALVPRRVSGNHVFNNTAVGGWWAFAVVCTDGSCSISNTEVTDNIFCASGGSSGEIYVFGGGSNNGTNGEGNAYRLNNWGTDGGGKVWGGAVYPSASAFEAASGGAIRGSLVGNPSFVDAGGGNFALRIGSPCVGVGSAGGNIGHTG